MPVPSFGTKFSIARDIRQLISERDTVALVDVSEFSVGRGTLDQKRATDRRCAAIPYSRLAAVFARAYIPIIVNQRPIAVVAAFVDQTEQRNVFFRTFVLAAASLCTLMGLSFGVPAVAWYRRTREKQHAERRIRSSPTTMC